MQVLRRICDRIGWFCCKNGVFRRCTQVNFHLYHYAGNNPVRYTDPTGEVAETAWDAFSLATGVQSFVENIKSGNVKGAVLDGLGIVADTAALALPCVPGGTGALIKGSRVADKLGDANKVVQNLDNLPLQKHHFASNKHSKFTKDFVGIADKYGLKLDGKGGEWNMESLPHQGRHPDKYHKFVMEGMQKADLESGGSKEKFLELFNEYVKEPVRNNPDMLRKSGWED